jgi:hypothetical protein
MRKFFFWPILILAGLLLALAGLTVFGGYELDFSSPAISVHLAQPSKR